ncbi:hypothetical protein CYMTET_29384 [Cymbomonas tetramitiformis]|uniref:J domain-containing protein n=1 Tax=Cymbomonas tetramitiformis TaxID=36881 RepID=A0AAE0KV05_9CHLO|nr:hypothetical protein CYMTET_29384 [Cymbomonas tetramitiformis]
MDEKNFDPYAELHLEGFGPNFTDEEIKKAYRKRALQCHPDKQKGGDKAAAEEAFQRVKKAFEILKDKDAKNLEKRERETEQSMNEEQAARNKLKHELDRIRRATEEARMQQREEAAGFKPMPACQGSNEQLKRTLKLSWERAAGTYDAARLKEIFSEFGEVEDVVLRDGKKKKATALIVMQTSAAAAFAADTPCGDFSNPIDVKGMGEGVEDKPSSSFSGSASRQTPQPQKSTFPASSFPSTFPSAHAPPAGSIPTTFPQSKPSTPSRAPPVVGSSHRDYENVTLMMMRQAAERQRAIAELEREEKEQERK